jgi:predicted anti-sigma-YlaC factor YlaD
MKPTPCGFEAAVTAAAGSEALTPALRDHVSGCHSCREILDVVQAMQRLAMQTASPPAPPYRGVWLRAEYARRQQRRARRELVQAIVPAAATAVFVSGLLIWKRPSLHDLVRGSIDLVASVPSLFTGGVTLAVLLGFVMLTFVLMEDSWSRDR